MCGIWASFGFHGDVDTMMKASLKIKHRGPDAYRFELLHEFKRCAMGFHHLAIMGSPLGMQPLRSSRYPHLVLLFNGEIYNYEKIFEAFNLKPESDSDGESILHLYQEKGIEYTTSMLDGMFAFCLLDTKEKKIHIARDTLGIKPLYAYLSNSALSISSEIKGLVDLQSEDSKDSIRELSPGTVETFKIAEDESVTFESRVKFHNFDDKPKWTQLEDSPVVLVEDIYQNIRTLLTEAVRKRLMSHRRLGCLLSGGLDSSLIAALVVKTAKEQGITYPIQTFCVGLDGGVDLAAARKVADYLGTEHHEVVYTLEEGVTLTETVIYQWESYDRIMLASAVPSCILFAYIKTKTDTVVMMSGSGCDELTQGYQLFYDVSTAEEANEVCHQQLGTLFHYSLRREERTAAAYGLELRVPYLDHNLVHYWLSLPSETRRPGGKPEKYLLRKAFDGMDLIPAEILWRRKLEFGDGVAPKSDVWFDALNEYAQSKLKSMEVRGKEDAKKPTEAKAAADYYYQCIFEKYYPNCTSVLLRPWDSIEVP